LVKYSRPASPKICWNTLKAFTPGSIPIQLNVNPGPFKGFKKMSFFKNKEAVPLQARKFPKNKFSVNPLE
jgi:hypothetical protein